MKYLLVLFLAGFFAPPSGAAELQLREFETDDCTMFPEGPPRKSNLWKHCCFEHDLRYWLGGDQTEMDFTDLQLKQCVEKVAGPLWGKLIYRGVRQGHKSPIQHRQHWSWGWTQERTLTPLTTAEKEIIRPKLQGMNLNPDYVQRFIQKYNLN